MGIYSCNYTIKMNAVRRYCWDGSSIELILMVISIHIDRRSVNITSIAMEFRRRKLSIIESSTGRKPPTQWILTIDVGFKSSSEKFYFFEEKFNQLTL